MTSSVKNEHVLELVSRVVASARKRGLADDGILSPWLAAILDAMMDFRLTIKESIKTSNLLVLMDSLTPKTMVYTPKLQLYHKQRLIYYSYNATAAILDAILKITPFR